jgi:hypothetical protein
MPRSGRTVKRADKRGVIRAGVKRRGLPAVRVRQSVDQFARSAVEVAARSAQRAAEAKVGDSGVKLEHVGVGRYHSGWAAGVHARGFVAPHELGTLGSYRLGSRARKLPYKATVTDRKTRRRRRSGIRPKRFMETGRKQGAKALDRYVKVTRVIR